MAEQPPDDYVEWATAHRTRLLRSAYLLTGGQSMAEDLVQEALIKVAARWTRLRGQNPTAYARTIIYRDHATWWRRRRETPVASLPDRASVPSEDAVENRTLIVESLVALTRKQRAVVVLRYFDDLTERETAELLGVSIGTVKSQASAALARLRQVPALSSHLEMQKEQPL